MNYHSIYLRFLRSIKGVFLFVVLFISYVQAQGVGDRGHGGWGLTNFVNEKYPVRLYEIFYHNQSDDLENKILNSCQTILSPLTSRTNKYEKNSLYLNYLKSTGGNVDKSKRFFNLLLCIFSRIEENISPQASEIFNRLLLNLNEKSGPYLKVLLTNQSLISTLEPFSYFNVDIDYRINPVVQLATRNVNTINIDANYFGQMSQLDQVFLLLHEAVYSLIMNQSFFGGYQTFYYPTFTRTYIQALYEKIIIFNGGKEKFVDLLRRKNLETLNYTTMQFDIKPVDNDRIEEINSKFNKMIDDVRDSDFPIPLFLFEAPESIGKALGFFSFRITSHNSDGSSDLSVKSFSSPKRTLYQICSEIYDSIEKKLILKQASHFDQFGETEMFRTPKISLDLIKTIFDSKKDNEDIFDFANLGSARIFPYHEYKSNVNSSEFYIKIGEEIKTTIDLQKKSKDSEFEFKLLPYGNSYYLAPSLNIFYDNFCSKKEFSSFFGFK